MADGGESVQKFAIFRGSVANAVGGQKRKIQRARNCDGCAVASFFFPMEMALELYIHVAATKQPNQLLDLLAGFIDAPMLQGGCEWTVRTAGQADKAMGVLFQLFFTDCAFAFFRAQLHFGDQTAEVLIARAGGNEQRQAEFTTETWRPGGILKWLIINC